MSSRDEALEKLPKRERWAVKFMSLVLGNELKEKYGEKKSKISEKSLCYDGRRSSTVHKTLLERDLVSHWMSPKMETILKEASVYACAPEFEIKGRKRSSSSVYATEDWKPLKKFTDGYRKLNNLAYTEIIYVYFHLDEFDVQKVHRSKTYTNRRYGCATREWDEIRLFPKDKIKDLRKAVCADKILFRARKHLNEFLERSFDQKFKTIKRPTSWSPHKEYNEKDMEDPGAFKIEAPFNKNEIDSRIHTACDQIRYLKESLKELKFFRRLAQQNDLEKLIQEKADLWMTEDAPLHLNSENSDLKELAKAILEGDNIDA